MATDTSFTKTAAATPSPGEALAQAATLHRAGKLDDAEKLYRRILAQEPEHATANHNLGALLLAKGNLAAALCHLEAAVAGAPYSHPFRHSLAHCLRLAGSHNRAAALEEEAHQAENALRQGNLLHQQGDLARAETQYRQVLARIPGHPHACCNLGAILQESQRTDEAAELYRLALQAKPDYADAWNNLGILLKDQDRPEEAKYCLERALQLVPGDADTLSNLGNTLRGMGRPEEAARLFRQALSQGQGAGAPRHWSNLGNAQLDCGLAEEALASYREALRLAPNYVPALANLGAALRHLSRLEEAEQACRRALELEANHLGAIMTLSTVFRDQKRLDEALALCRQAASLSPKDAEVLDNLATVLFDRQELGEAEAVCREALAQKPGHVETLSVLSSVLQGQNRLDEACALCQEALERSPSHAKALMNLSAAYYHQGHLDAAKDTYAQALKATPEAPDIVAGLSDVLLARGELAEGWKYARNRFDRKRTHPISRRPFSQPEWDGSSGKGVVAWGEQGIADELWFGSLLPELRASGVALIVETDRRLVKLFSRALPGVSVVPRTDPPASLALAAEQQLAMADLAKFLRPELASFEGRTGIWLKPDPLRRQFWQERLAALPGPRKIGFSWRSTLAKHSPWHLSYPPLEAWEQILRIPGITWINFQYDYPQKELDRINELAEGRIATLEGLDTRDGQDDLAAVMANLDCVVGVANAPVILAACLGVPTLTLWTDSLRISWRRHGKDFTPWFPGMKLIAKSWRTPWSQAMDELAAHLAAGCPSAQEVAQAQHGHQQEAQGQ